MLVRIVKKVVACLIFILIIAIFGCGEKAQIIGEVIDEKGAPLKDATVSVEGASGKFKASTDDKGKLMGKVRSYLWSRQLKPDIVANHFQGKHVQYAA
jgi:hypothetical protein